MMVKPLKGAEVPAGVVTVKVRVVNSAVGAIVIVIGKLVLVPPDPTVAVTPLPLNATAVAPDRFVPAIMAGSVVPCAPEVGAIDVIVGTKPPCRTVAVKVGLFERNSKPVNAADTRK